MKNKTLQLLESKTVFKGRVFSVTRDTVCEPGGVEATREIVRHVGSAVIMPRRDDGSILLVRQFRLPASKPLWELAAGRLNPGEVPLQAARRELEEETGLQAERWKLLAEYYASPGYVDERMFLFLAEGLKQGKTNPDPDEKISRRWFAQKQLEGMIRTGKIEDGKTLAGYLFLTML